MVPNLKSTIAAEIERIAGNHLTPEVRDKIAERAIKLIEDFNRNLAVAAIATVKHNLTEAADNSAILEAAEQQQKKADPGGGVG